MGNEFEDILKRVLRKNSQQLPYRNRVKGYAEDLKERLKDYVEQIKKIDTSRPIGKELIKKVKIIQKTNMDLIEALTEYYSGNVGNAYRRIERLFNRDSFPYILGELVEGMSLYDGAHEEANSLFRVRLDLSGDTDVTQMFHIPFDKRQLVKTQRYSIAGVPCLYLGSSLFVCWQELGKPDMNRMYLSHCKMAKSHKNTRIIDFGYTLESLRSNQLDVFSKQPQPEKIIAYLMAWPVVMACSYTVQHPDSDFKEEYIIPNMVLQWISSNKEVSGIKYVSTKTSIPENVGLCVNYVFPTKSLQATKSGHCEILSKRFVLSEPISWQLLETSAESEINMGTRISQPSKVDSLEHYLLENYSSTKFYQNEQKLRAMARLRPIA